MAGEVGLRLAIELLPARIMYIICAYEGWMNFMCTPKENTLDKDHLFLRFLDDEGKIKQLPSKVAPRSAVLGYLSTKFFCERDYSEKEVNEIISLWHTFHDYFLLRRELIDCHFLCRTTNGARYWKNPASTCPNSDAPETPSP